MIKSWQSLLAPRNKLRPRSVRRDRSIRLQVEDLEGRLVPANLWVTDFRLVTEYWHPGTTPVAITSTAEGTLAHVQVSYQTQDLPANAQFTFTFTLDKNPGLTWTSAPLTNGAGQAGVLTPDPYMVRLWVLQAGTHTIDVQLKALNFNPTTPAGKFGTLITTTSGTFQSAYNGEHNFITPLGGTPNKDWFINNYVDDNPNSDLSNPYKPGTYNDYTGGLYTYNGHEGMDYSLANFAAMDVGPGFRSTPPPPARSSASTTGSLTATRWG
jgi:hypothetical protein